MTEARETTAETAPAEIPFDFTVGSIDISEISVAPIDDDLRGFGPARCN